MKHITIPWDYSCDKGLSFMEVVSAMENGVEDIVTNCTDFFCFDTLRGGYEVTVWKADGSTITLSKLLGDNPYTPKEIRHAHNARKMLVAGALEFIPSQVEIK